MSLPAGYSIQESSGPPAGYTVSGEAPPPRKPQGQTQRKHKPPTFADQPGQGQAALTKMGDLLQRTGNFSYSLLAGHPLGEAANVFAHGERLEDNQADFDKAAARVDPMYAGSPEWVKNIDRAVAGAVLDPGSYAAGPIGKVAKALTLPEMASSTLARGASLTKVTGKVYDAFTHKGEQVRKIYQILNPKDSRKLLDRMETIERKASNVRKAAQGLGAGSSAVNPFDVSAKTRLARLSLTKAQKNDPELMRALTDYFEPRSSTLDNPIVQRLYNFTNIGTFMTPTGHVMNIGSLATKNPMAAVKAVGLMARAMTKNGRAANAARLARDEAKGLIGTPVERTIPKVIPGNAKALTKMGQLFQKEYQWSQRQLWTADNLFRSSMIEDEAASLMRGGMPKAQAYARAAHNVNRALVDYAMRSPAVDKLYMAGPFATFHSAIMRPTINQMVTRPGQLAAMDRVTGGMFTGGTSASGGKMYTPQARVGRALDSTEGLARFGESFIGWPVWAMIAAAKEAERQAYPSKNAYGKKEQARERKYDWGRVASGIATPVGGQEALQALHLSPFKDKGLLDELLLSQLRYMPGQ